MGPRVSDDMSTFTLRPYRTSQTYQNLKRTSEGVLHVTDDVELLARSAINRLDTLPELRPASAVAGWVLADCCRWFAFRVASLDDREERTTIECETVDRGRMRDFVGFNRACHAVIEAAILATRIDFLPHDEIIQSFAELAVLVEKTGGGKQRRAFQFLESYVAECGISGPGH